MEGRTDLYHGGLPLNNSCPYPALYYVLKIQLCVTEMAAAVATVGPIYGPVGMGLTPCLNLYRDRIAALSTMQCMFIKGNSSENIISAKIHSMDSVYTITRHATFLVNKCVHIQRKSKLSTSQNLQSAILNQLLPVTGSN